MRVMTEREEFTLPRLMAFISGVAAKVGAPPFPAAGSEADVDAWILDVSARVAASIDGIRDRVRGEVSA